MKYLTNLQIKIQFTNKIKLGNESYKLIKKSIDVHKYTRKCKQKFIHDTCKHIRVELQIAFAQRSVEKFIQDACKNIRVELCNHLI